MIGVMGMGVIKRNTLFEALLVGGVHRKCASQTMSTQALTSARDCWLMAMYTIQPGCFPPRQSLANPCAFRITLHHVFSHAWSISQCRWGKYEVQAVARLERVLAQLVQPSQHSQLNHSRPGKVGGQRANQARVVAEQQIF